MSKLNFSEYVNKTHTSVIQSLRGEKSKGGGRPNETESPWIQLGISRATYYRRLNRI